MEATALLQALHTAERLKDATRHCYTSEGRHESVAEHSWRISLMAYTFLKTSSDEKREDELLAEWVSTLPQPFREEMAALYREMNERKTLEARIFKAMDSLEALIQHNESNLSTWSENEYELNMHYADDKVSFSPYLTSLRELIRKDTIAKIEAESS